MVKGNQKTYEKLLKSATLEFAEKGFQQASIRSISGRAGLTIGALYQHFDNKEAVFNHVVSPVYSGFLALSDTKKKEFTERLEDEGSEEASQYIAGITLDFMSYVRDHWTLFLILISNQETKIYRHFFKRIVTNEVEMTLLLLKRLNQNKYRTMTYEELELIVSAQYSGILALMRARTSERQMEVNLGLLFRFYHYGWEGLINHETGEL